MQPYFYVLILNEISCDSLKISWGQCLCVSRKRNGLYTVYIDPKILNQIELKMTKIQEHIKYKIYLQEMTTVLSNVGRISHISLHLLLEE